MMKDLIGQEFGKYRLIRLLGQGGFAEVYLGQHIYLKTEAAIKILHTRMSREQVLDFLQEAQVIARMAPSVSATLTMVHCPWQPCSATSSRSLRPCTTPMKTS